MFYGTNINNSSNKIKKNKRSFFDKINNIFKKEDKIKICKMPKFKIEKHKHVINFDKIKNIKSLNIKYPLIEPFCYVNLKWNSENKEVEYNLMEPLLTIKEKESLTKISETLIENIDIGIDKIKNLDNIIIYLENEITNIIKEFGIKINDNQYKKILYYIYRNFVGLNEIEPLMQDSNIEDISCDGINSPIYIIHKKFGSIKTNISFNNKDHLIEFITKLSEKTGRYVSYAEPILDGTLNDGSRVSATIASDVATRGPTFTIRKFSEKPLSPIDQIELGTINSEILSYYWYIIEHELSILFVGGVSTGKTSMLNTVSIFIPSESKIVSIEDTREIRIPHQHWIAGLTRNGFGSVLANGKKYGEITLFDLLKESFRQNPNYVIVGEVRGDETYVMFQGMSSGHPSLSTFHAGSVEGVIKRLTTPPINLSASLIESLDIITIMIHAREHGKSARRIKEISEIISIDSKTEEIKTNTVFKWNSAIDSYVKINDSIKLKKISELIGSNIKEINKDLEDRKKVIEWLKINNIRDYIEVSKYLYMYRKEKNQLMEKIKKDFKKEKKYIENNIIKSEYSNKINYRKKSIVELMENIGKNKEK